jgi:hypothetical protein
LFDALNAHEKFPLGIGCAAKSLSFGQLLSLAFASWQA